MPLVLTQMYTTLLKIITREPLWKRMTLKHRNIESKRPVSEENIPDIMSI